MANVTYRLAELANITLNLGYTGENETKTFIIDCKKVFDDYPNATPVLTVKPPKGLRYPAEITQDGNNIIWKIRDYDLNYDGDGEIQLKFTENGKIKKSVRGKTKIDEGLEPEGTAPTPIQDWFDQAEDVLESLDGLTVSAETLETGEDATATVSEDAQGHKHISFGLPRGPQGDPGQDDYNDLENLPQIGGVTLQGDKTPAELGLLAGTDVTEAVEDYLEENFTNPDSPPLDRTLSSALSAAPADIMGKAALVKDSDEEDVDLDVSDASGNVIMRLENGHIKTKEFDSETIGDLEDLETEENDTLVDAINEVKAETGDKIDMPEGGTAGQVLGLDSNLDPAWVDQTGGDSSGVKVVNSEKTGVDFDVSDNTGNVLLRMEKGHIRTAIFDSESLYTDSTTEKTNLYNNASGDMLLAFNSGTFAQATALHGFYVPVDPSRKVLTIKKRNPGTVLRTAFSANVPAVGVTYTDAMNGEGNAVLERFIPAGANYLYIGYYNSENDTLTQAELLAGMEIYYGEEDKFKPVESITNRLTYLKNVKFVNGYMNVSGQVVASNASVISSEIISRGRSRVVVPQEYKVILCLIQMDGNGVVFSEEITNKTFWFDHYGRFRVVIKNADGTNIEPADVDFSKMKFRTNEISAEAFANKNGKVLDAETARVDELYEYIDSAVKTHGNYVTKTLLCTETTGLPINYYTLGSGATKIVIVSGQHSPPRDPKDSVITLAKLMHDLVTCNFTAGSFLQKLHDDCTLLVIPLMNPYGFEHNVDLTYEGVNLNADWVTQSTEVVQLAASLITTFDPDIGLDIHCNGSTPLEVPNVGIQFNLASDNNDVYSDVHTYFENYYNTTVDKRDNTAENTLRHFITVTLGKPGGLIETRWWLKSSETLHDAQTETINYSMIVNVLKWFVCSLESEQYDFEIVPTQNQY